MMNTDVSSAPNAAFVAPDWSVAVPVLPELVLLAAGVALVLLDLFAPRQRQVLRWLTALGAGIALLVTLRLRTPQTEGAMLVNDGYAAFFGALCLGSVLLTALLRETYPRRGEFFSLLTFSAMGMLVMTAAADLMTIYLGLELMALPLYVLVGMRKRDPRTSEAAAKYFLTGVFASAFLLFGMSLLYGLAGTSNLAQIGARVPTGHPALLVALGLVLVGLCFKVAVVPCHMWTPDVYEGAPTTLAAFMSVGPKAAGFAVFGRMLFTIFPDLTPAWGPILTLLAVLTMLVGNLAALAQKSLKRMLAYSAIAHAGYALLGLAAGTAEGQAAAMSYLFIYLFMNTGAFAILLLLARGREDHEGIESCRGLALRNPLPALCMLVFMFSLTGIPPTGGFAGKFFLFKTALAAGHTAAVVLAVLLSAVSAFFYLRVVRLMYMSPADGEPPLAQPRDGVVAVLVIAALGTLLLGLAPGPLFDWAGRALIP